MDEFFKGNDEIHRGRLEGSFVSKVSGHSVFLSVSLIFEVDQIRDQIR